MHFNSVGCLERQKGLHLKKVLLLKLHYIPYKGDIALQLLLLIKMNLVNSDWPIKSGLLLKHIVCCGLK